MRQPRSFLARGRLGASLFVATFASALLAIGCADRTIELPANSGSDQSTVPRTLPAGSLVREVKLTRKVRNASNLATHVLGVSETVVDDTLSSSEALAWAQDALAQGEFDVYTDAPFGDYPELVLTYHRYFDALTVANSSLSRPSWAELQAIGPNEPLDMGIGAAAAESIATNLLAQMESGGAVAPGPYLFAGTRYSRRALTRTALGETYSAVSEYAFLFHRSIESLPVLNTFVRIVVRRDGKIKAVEVHDIDFEGTIQLRTRISDDDAFASMLEQAEDELHPSVVVDEAILEQKETGYFLPADETSAEYAPVAKAKIIFRTPDHVTRARTGTISLDVERPNFSYVPEVPLPPRAARPNGETCTDDADCVSGFCYQFAGMGGICGGCADDSTCTYGCNPPGMLTYPPTPSACGDGTLGSGCESDADCTGGRVCGLVKTSATGHDLRTCGGCKTQANCGSEVCGITFNFGTQKAYRKCSAVSARDLGSICETNSQCASNRCSPYVFPDGTSVGVCGQCLTNAHCGGSGACIQTDFDFATGFSHSVCG